MPVTAEFDCVINLCSLWSQSYPSLCYRTEPRQTPVHGIFPSRQEYCSGLPFPSLGDLPDLGIQLSSPASPALAVRFFTTGGMLYLRIPCD